MGPLPGRWALFYACYQVFPTGLPPRQSRQGSNPSLWTASACRHAPCFSLSRLADLPIPPAAAPHTDTLAVPLHKAKHAAIPAEQAFSRAGGIQDCTIWHQACSTVQPEQAALCCAVSPDSVLLCCHTSPLRSKAHTNGKTPILQCK